MKTVGLGIAITFILVVLAVSFVGNAPTPTQNPVSSSVAPTGENVAEIAARGGYSPERVYVKAGKQATLRVVTKSTFDCSSALVIPSLGVSKRLPPTGVTDIVLPERQPGTILEGMCAMGMYRFQVVYE